MEFHAFLESENGILRVGQKYISFRDRRIGEVGRDEDTRYYWAEIGSAFASAEKRKDAVVACLKESPYKIPALK